MSWMDGFDLGPGAQSPPVRPAALGPNRRQVTVAQCPACGSIDLRVRTSGSGRATELECAPCHFRWKESGDVVFRRSLVLG